jgi:hypothetical protein
MLQCLSFLLKALWCTFCGNEQEEEDEDEISFQQYHILPHFCQDVQNALNI